LVAELNQDLTASPSGATAGDATAAPPLERKFSLRQRLAIWLISTAVTVAIRVIGRTLRYSVEVEEGSAPSGHISPAIYCFWHECIFSAAYIHRNNPVSVMTSRSFDGEYIARIIENLGFGAVRGSSSRGGVRALREMHQEIEQGRVAAFTIDGPRGPRHVAKPGPVLLAKNTQAPILCFHLSHSSAWVLNSWDKLQIPKPFSRVHLVYSKMIRVPSDANDGTLKLFHAELQTTLDRTCETAERKFRNDA
jgi:lysophospholipid acyltransferase (LPLAT)-like uncharacterized protein